MASPATGRSCCNFPADSESDRSSSIYRAILAVDVPLELVVVTGRNAKIKTELERIEVPEQHLAHVLGFTTEMDELLAAADVVVTKPGGLTTSEVLARGAVMAIINPIPGQESRNSDFLLENGAAIKLNNISTLPYKLTNLLRDSKRLASLKAHARRLGRPQAAFDVARRRWRQSNKGESGNAAVSRSTGFPVQAQVILPRLKIMSKCRGQRVGSRPPA